MKTRGERGGGGRGEGESVKEETQYQAEMKQREMVEDHGLRRDRVSFGMVAKSMLRSIYEGEGAGGMHKVMPQSDWCVFSRFRLLGREVERCWITVWRIRIHPNVNTCMFG